jgi:hypothetical protein
MASLTEVLLLSGGVYGFGLIDGGEPARIWFTHATEEEATAAHQLAEHALSNVVKVIGAGAVP